jgi:hypothetical protein
VFALDQEATLLIKSDLDAPARLQCWPTIPDLCESARREDAKRFQSLRETLRAAVTEKSPDGKAVYLLTASGMALKPDKIPEIWSAFRLLVRRTFDLPPAVDW